MNLQEINGLMDRFEKSDMTEMQIELEGVKIVCKREKETIVAPQPFVHTQSLQEFEPITGNLAMSGAVANNATGSEEKTVIDTSKIQVKATVAGTFYRATSPEQEPYIQVGQEVKKGDVIGLIEAMKLMNEIVSPVDGIVAEISVKNEELVGYDDVLILLDPK